MGFFNANVVQGVNIGVADNAVVIYGDQKMIDFCAPKTGLHNAGREPFYRFFSVFRILLIYQFEDAAGVSLGGASDNDCIPGHPVARL